MIRGVLLLDGWVVWRGLVVEWVVWSELVDEWVVWKGLMVK